MVAWGGARLEGYEETFGSDGEGHYPDCGDGFTDIHISKLIKLNTLKMQFTVRMSIIP